MCQDYEEFTRRDVEVLVIGPDGPNAFRRYWKEHQIPFTGMADGCSKVASKYHQEVNLFKLGRMPALFLIDEEGVVRYNYYSDDMADIPTNQDVLETIDRLKTE